MSTDAHSQAKDSFVTSAGQQPTFGVEIHATAAANLLHGNWIKRFSTLNEILGLVALVFVFSFAMLSLKPLWSTLVWVGSSITWIFCAYRLFLKGYFLPGLSVVLLVLPCIFLSTLLYYYFITKRAKHRIHSALSCYVSPVIADAVAERDEDLSSGSSIVEVTLLFGDIAGFTSTAECTSKLETRDLANAYYQTLRAAIERNQGMYLDAFGDGFLAIWGHPIRVSNPSDLALNCAEEIQRELDNLCMKKKIPVIKLRFGIHRSEVDFGNFGGDAGLKYTAMGDGVNLASRLEGLNKFLGTNLLLSKEVLNDLKGSSEAIPLGSIQVYGKSAATEIFTLPTLELDASFIDSWTQALNLFKERKWEKARHAFERVRNEATGEFSKTAALYLQFVDKYEKDEPSHDWAGELRLENK